MASFEAAVAAAERRLHGGSGDAGTTTTTTTTTEKKERRRRRRKDEEHGADEGDCGGEGRGAGGGAGGWAATAESPACIASRVLQAHEKKNYNECLLLPPVYKNALGRCDITRPIFVDAVARSGGPGILP